MTDAWVQLINGGKFSLDGSPHELDGLTVADVAKSLAQITRYRGATRFPVSVAAHSVLVSNIAEDLGGPVAGLYGLVHDVHEIILSDIPAPVKAYFDKRSGGRFADWLRELEREADFYLWPIFRAYFPATIEQQAVVRRADLIALATEKRDATVSRRKWNLSEYPSTRYVVGRTDVDDAAVFIRRLGELHRKLGIVTARTVVTAP